MRQYHRVCVAGTFDGIHAGHEVLLGKAFEVGDSVLIGLTSDAYVARYKLPRSSYVLRKQRLEEWLRQHRYHATVVPIDDPFEPASSDPDLVALIVSEETKARGEELNAIRKKRGLPPLVLVTIPLIAYVLPEYLRKTLSAPLGPVCSSFARPGLAKLITVGDVTTKTALEQSIVPKRMIIDHKVNRKPCEPLPLPSGRRVRVQSGPGYISSAAMDALRSDAVIIEVDGEEDLLALPAISEAPLGSFVYYGQPDEGMVEVRVTGKKKREVRDLLRQCIVQ